MKTEQDSLLFRAIFSWQRYARHKMIWENKEKSIGVKSAEGRFKNRARYLAVESGYDPDDFFEICERFVKVE